MKVPLFIILNIAGSAELKNFDKSTEKSGNGTDMANSSLLDDSEDSYGFQREPITLEDTRNFGENLDFSLIYLMSEMTKQEGIIMTKRAKTTMVLERTRSQKKKWADNSNKSTRVDGQSPCKASVVVDLSKIFQAKKEEGSFILGLTKESPPSWTSTGETWHVENHPKENYEVLNRNIFIEELFYPLGRQVYPLQVQSEFKMPKKNTGAGKNMMLLESEGQNLFSDFLLVSSP